MRAMTASTCRPLAAKTQRLRRNPRGMDSTVEFERHLQEVAEAGGVAEPPARWSMWFECYTTALPNRKHSSCEWAAWPRGHRHDATILLPCLAGDAGAGRRGCSGAFWSWLSHQCPTRRVRRRNKNPTRRCLEWLRAC